jgi:hypothetical protein
MFPIVSSADASSQGACDGRRTFDRRDERLFGGERFGEAAGSAQTVWPLPDDSIKRQALGSVASPR